MPRPHIVFDIETILDTEAAERAYKIPASEEAALTEAVGAFPKTPLHRIVAIAALTLTYDITDQRWTVREMASLHSGGGDDKELVREFLTYLHATGPVLVSYNGAAFDLPVLRARAMLHRLSAPTLALESFKPFSRDHVDLCDTLWGRGPNRMTLDQSARVFDVGAKMQGVDGSKVDALAAIGDFDLIADYCLDDVIITAGLFLLDQTWKGGFSGERMEQAMARLRAARDHIVTARPTSFIRHVPSPLVSEL